MMRILEIFGRLVCKELSKTLSLLMDSFLRVSYWQFLFVLCIIIDELHIGNLSGHFGRNETLALVQANFF